eukprot:scaffold52214_cov169-Isochrysis_galbana.AAC.1
MSLDAGRWKRGRWKFSELRRASCCGARGSQSLSRTPSARWCQRSRRPGDRWCAARVLGSRAVPPPPEQLLRTPAADGSSRPVAGEPLQRARQAAAIHGSEPGHRAGARWCRRSRRPNGRQCGSGVLGRCRRARSGGGKCKITACGE